MENSAAISAIGKTFGRVTVICESGKRDKGRSKIFWLQCACGNLCFSRLWDLENENVKSCGCLKNEKIKLKNIARAKHRMCKTGIYYSWGNMHTRCKNSKTHNYKSYGKRGISVCQEWSDFIAFKNWAFANGYRNGLTIDRIDNNGNYEPSNCQWLTREENTRKARKAQKDKMLAALGAGTIGHAIKGVK